MSDEKPQFHGSKHAGTCPACHFTGESHDRSTGLCVDCWRILVLMPWSLNQMPQFQATIVMAKVSR